MPTDLMETALKQSELRSYVGDFEKLRKAIRETHAADENTIFYVRVSFDQMTITHAMGSTDLVLAAITEGLKLIIPHLNQHSRPEIQIQWAGNRKGWT